MTTFRHRMLVATLAILAAGLSACASDPTSPLDHSAAPTIPWH
jgi:hypothetical protein